MHLDGSTALEYIFRLLWATDSSILFLLNTLFCRSTRSNTMAQHVVCHKRLGADLSVDGRCNKRSGYHSLYSNEEIAHLKAMCAQFSCLFHDVIPIFHATGSRNKKGGMCRDFSCPHGIQLHALLRTECSIIARNHHKAHNSSESSEEI